MFLGVPKYTQNPATPFFIRKKGVSKINCLQWNFAMGSSLARDRSRLVAHPGLAFLVQNKQCASSLLTLLRNVLRILVRVQVIVHPQNWSTGDTKSRTRDLCDCRWVWAVAVKNISELWDDKKIGRTPGLRPQSGAAHRCRPFPQKVPLHNTYATPPPPCRLPPNCCHSCSPLEVRGVFIGRTFRINTSYDKGERNQEAGTLSINAV